MHFPADYSERVYAGVLGKIIGVYLGRPFEGWPYERIMRELGEIRCYVHEKCGKPLIVTDDDISGTFTFFRALADNGCSPDLTAEQIGRTWLNYLIEHKTILWWGGKGNSTEHTAYLRLKQGIPAPMSGAIQTNGPVVAEQIGGQIFIDAWAMVYPGDPEKAAEFARRAASVSHDGEGVYGAQVLAAMEAQAFVEQEIQQLVETGLSVIPHHSVIYRMINDLCEWHATDADWLKTFRRIERQYGYDSFPGNCHMVPNHALIILGLLYGQGDFQQSMAITNTCGWDTDCNSGNLGCLLGIRNGLAGFQGQVDWRGPVADRIYMPTMDGGRCVTDALTESFQVINTARRMRTLPTLHPKQNARFHFELPGSQQGFRVDLQELSPAEVRLENVAGHSQMGERSLAIHFTCPRGGNVLHVSTPTFILPEDIHMPGYSLIASPTLYPGQVIEAGLSADISHTGPVDVNLCLDYYDHTNQPAHLRCGAVRLEPGEYLRLEWQVPALEGKPIYAVGFEIQTRVTGQGSVYLDYLTWTGVAETVFSRPAGYSIHPQSSNMWARAWVCAVDQWDQNAREAFRLVQNAGRGLVTTGVREWEDYTLRAQIRSTMMMSGGLAARVQGMQRYYALLLTGQKTARLTRVYDGQEIVLAEAPCEWGYWEVHNLALEVKGEHIKCCVDGKLLVDIDDIGSPLTCGAIGLLVEEGLLMTDAVHVRPV